MNSNTDSNAKRVNLNRKIIYFSLLLFLLVFVILAFTLGWFRIAMYNVLNGFDSWASGHDIGYYQSIDLDEDFVADVFVNADEQEEIVYVAEDPERVVISPVFPHCRYYFKVRLAPSALGGYASGKLLDLCPPNEQDISVVTGGEEPSPLPDLADALNIRYFDPVEERQVDAPLSSLFEDETRDIVLFEGYLINTQTDFIYEIYMPDATENQYQGKELVISRVSFKITN